jgi:hypothetical protein
MKLVLALDLLLIQNKGKNINLAVDKAKPRAIVGRKATGPTGIAGLPNGNERNRVAVAHQFQQSGFCFKINT